MFLPIENDQDLTPLCFFNGNTPGLISCEVDWAAAICCNGVNNLLTTCMMSQLPPDRQQSVTSKVLSSSFYLELMDANRGVLLAGLAVLALSAVLVLFVVAVCCVSSVSYVSGVTSDSSINCGSCVGSISCASCVSNLSCVNSVTACFRCFQRSLPKFHTVHTHAV